jgi:hypothetical protein
MKNDHKKFLKIFQILKKIVSRLICHIGAVLLGGTKIMEKKDLR